MPIRDINWDRISGLRDIDFDVMSDSTESPSKPDVGSGSDFMDKINEILSSERFGLPKTPLIPYAENTPVAREITGAAGQMVESNAKLGEAMEGLKQEADPNDSLIESIIKSSANQLVSAGQMAHQILTLPAVLPAQVISDPYGAVSGFMQFVGGGIKTLMDADVLELGPQSDDPVFVEQFRMAKNEARKSLFKDTISPLGAAAVAAGAIVKGGPKNVEKFREVSKQQVLESTAEILTSEKSKPSGPLMLPDYSNMGVMVDRPVAGKRVPPAPGLEQDFSATASPGGKASLSLEPAAVGEVTSLGPQYLQKRYLERQKFEQASQSVHSETTTLDPGLVQRLPGVFEKGSQTVRSGLAESEVLAAREHISRPGLPAVVPTIEEIGTRMERKSSIDRGVRNLFENIDDAPVAVGAFQKFVANLPRTVEDAQARGEVFKRASELQQDRFRTGEIVRKVREEFKGRKSELDDLRYHIEGTINPETKKPVAVSRRGHEVATELSAKMKERFDELVDAGHLSAESEIEGFVSHFWTGSSKNKRRMGQMVMKARTGRVLPTYKDGIDLGLKPLHRDVLGDFAAYQELGQRVIVNNHLVESLWHIKDGEGRPLISPNTKNARALRPDWVEVNHPALNKAMYMATKGKAGKKYTLQTYPSTLVDPSIVKSVKRVFEESLSPGNKWLGAMRTTNAFAKAIQLGVSFFHPFSLLESAVSINGIRGVVKYRTALDMIRKDPVLLKEVSDHGLVLGQHHDVGGGILKHALEKLESRSKGTPVLAETATFVRAFNDVWNQKLWDEYQTGLKVAAYYKMKGILSEKFSNVNPKFIGEEAAAFANDGFGGQNWDRMLMNPRIQEGLHLTFLAPDWTISNIKQAGHLFESKKTGAIRAYLGGLPPGAAQEMATRSSMQGVLGRRYWARNAAYTFLGLQMMNYLFSSMNDDPHFTWDNDPGHEFDFELPYKDDQGRKQYAQVAKQTREIVRWVTHPIENFGSKAAPFIRWVTEQGTNHSLGSGFPAPWAEDKETGLKPSFVESIPQRAGRTAEYFVPFSLTGDNFAFTLPVSKGMTAYQFIAQYKEAILDEDADQKERLKIAAKMNGLPVMKLIDFAKRDLNRREKKYAE